MPQTPKTAIGKLRRSIKDSSFPWREASSSATKNRQAQSRMLSSMAFAKRKSPAEWRGRNGSFEVS